jgi:serpin B
MHPFLSRRRFLSLTGAAAAGTLLARSLGYTCPMAEIEPSDEAKAIADAVNGFAVDLHRQLADDKDTLFFSPFSISAALAMTSAGARGETLAEMEKVLHLPKNPHAGFGDLLSFLNGADTVRGRGYQLAVANAIWAQKGFPWHREFVELTRKHYSAGTIEVDFGESEAARKRINDWVQKETREKIKDLIPAGVINGLTRMVLANAIYFKGDWQVQFDKKLTKDAPFTRDDGTRGTVPLMNLTGEFRYGETTLFYVERAGEKVQVLELPYAGRGLSMLVFLPEDPAFVHRLPRCLSAADFAAPKLDEQKVNVFLPRFKAESKLSLKPTLMDMGMKTAFGGADFTGMSPEGKSLFVSAVLHKAFVDVNEEGTEAAAATGVVIAQRVSAPKEPKVFRADRPFVFAIRDNKTSAVLFLGRYCGPKA